MTEALPKIIVRCDDADSFEIRKETAESALEAGYTYLLISDDEISRIGKINGVFRKGDELSFGDFKGKFVTVNSGKDIENISDDDYDFIIVKTNNWKIIPLENLISRLGKTKIYACVNNSDDAELASNIMESGCFGFVLDCEASEISKFIAPNKKSEKIELTEAEITKITPIGLGDRVCVDTISVLSENEGLLIGSQSDFLFLVCSENLKTEYSEARPFRVNAGAVHSYVLCGSETTKYLSEIKSGVSVLCADSNGNTREAVTGRAKTELRPMILIEAKVCGVFGTVILQNAETVRLASNEKPVSVSDLKEGDKVLVRLEKSGRHFGRAVNETITEK